MCPDNGIVAKTELHEVVNFLEEEAFELFEEPRTEPEAPEVVAERFKPRAALHSLMAVIGMAVMLFSVKLA